MDLTKRAHVATMGSFLIGAYTLGEHLVTKSGGSAMQQRLLVMFFAGLLLAAYLHYKAATHKREPEGRSRKPTPVIGKKFENESLALDGHSYISCDFRSVTLTYNDMAPFSLGLHCLSDKETLNGRGEDCLFTLIHQRE